MIYALIAAVIVAVSFIGGYLLGFEAGELSGFREGIDCRDEV